MRYLLLTLLAAALLAAAAVAVLAWLAHVHGDSAARNKRLNDEIERRR